MKRVDLYRTVHKGLRAALFEAAAAAARTDFADAEEAARTAARIRATLAFFTEHAEHEDEVILPELARICPELAADLRHEHARVEGIQEQTEALVERLADSTEALREALGLRIQERLGAMIVEHLRHMEREETEANRMLWAHRSDEELLVLNARIVAPIPPERMAEWMVLILPAANRSERAEMLAGIRAEAPPEAFERIMAPAREVLGSAAWEAALQG